MKITILSFLLTALFLIPASVIHAQSSTPSATIPSAKVVQSDFSNDLQQGQKDTANDLEAQKNQKDLKDNENVGVNEQGETINEQQGVNQEDMVEAKEGLNSQQGDNSSSIQSESDTGKAGNQSSGGLSNSATGSSQQEGNH